MPSSSQPKQYFGRPVRYFLIESICSTCLPSSSIIKLYIFIHFFYPYHSCMVYLFFYMYHENQPNRYMYPTWMVWVSIQPFTVFGFCRVHRAPLSSRLDSRTRMAFGIFCLIFTSAGFYQQLSVFWVLFLGIITVSEMKWCNSCQYCIFTHANKYMCWFKAPNHVVIQYNHPLNSQFTHQELLLTLLCLNIRNQLSLYLSWCLVLFSDFFSTADGMWCIYMSYMFGFGFA